MSRTLPRSLASVVEDLELDQPELVTMSILRDVLDRNDVATPPKLVAARLRTLGWLLATGTRGVWEFSPGAHAGAISRGNPARPLAATLAAHPNLPAALALSSAAWAHGYADRAPARLEVAVSTGTPAPAALSRATRVVAFTPHLDPVTAKGVPAHQPATILVHMASSPTHVRSWTSALEWLPDLTSDLDPADLRTELDGRSASTRTRAGYLLSGVRPDLAEPLRQHVTGPVRFGRRSGPLVRHNQTWRVLDTLLPSDPQTWGSDHA